MFLLKLKTRIENGRPLRSERSLSRFISLKKSAFEQKSGALSLTISFASGLINFFSASMRFAIYGVYNLLIIVFIASVPMPVLLFKHNRFFVLPDWLIKINARNMPTLWNYTIHRIFLKMHNAVGKNPRHKINTVSPRVG